MKARHGFAAFCFVLATAAASAAGDSPRVGPHGDPSRLVIEGARTFSAEEIRTALFNEFDVIDASDKDDPLDTWTALLATKTIAGYQCAGFPDVKAELTDSGGQLTLTIDEGDRFTEGAVRVSGNQAIDANQVRDDLTGGEGKTKQRPVWHCEGPASFNSEYRDWLRTKVADLAGDQGFYRPSLNVSVTPDREAKKGTLQIDFIDEGPRATLNDVTIEGDSTNSLEALLAYLALDPQTPLTRDVRQQVEKQLLRSGRFLRVHWELGEAADRDDAWRPRLSLKEYEMAPPLGEPTTREETALLKLAAWIERFEESDEEVLIRFPDENVSVIFAPRHGFIIEAAPRLDAEAADRRDGFSSAIVMAEERVGLYSAARRRKIDAAPPPAPIMGNAEITLVDGQPGLSGRGSMVAGVGMRATTSKALRRHVQMKLKLTAAAALSVVRTHKAKAAWDGDIVCFEWMHRQMRVNALTGQLIEQVVHAPPEDDEDADRDDLSLPHIKIGSGQFERRLAEIEKLSADWPNAADDRRPLSCVAEFLCEELQQFDAESKSGYAAIGKLIHQGLLRSVDDLVAHMGGPEPETFQIPQRYFHWRCNSVEELIGLGPVLARAYGIGLGNRLFSQDGWTQTVWRKGVFLLADGRTEASDDLSCQPADDRGALCALVSAEMLRAAGHGPLAAVCARRGLRRLSPAAFRDDCRALLGGGGLVSECFLQMAEALRRLNAADVKAIAALLTRLDVLDESQGGIFEQCASALRTDGEATTPQAAAHVLDALWRAGLSDRVERRLKSLAAPSELPTPPPFAYTYGASDDAYMPGATEGPPAVFGRARPATAEGVYRAALPGETPGYFSPPDGSQSDDGPDSPSEPPKPIQQEVRELKWLAMALTDRLKKLEERLQSDEGESAEAALPIPEPDGAAVGDANPGYSLLLRGPDGLQFVPGSPSAPAPLPTALWIPRGEVVPFSLCGVKGHGDEPIYVRVHVARTLPEELLPLTRDGLPLVFTEPHLNSAFAGRAVTQVLCLVRVGGEQKIETLTSADEDENLIAEASARGVILATVSVSKEEGIDPPAIRTAPAADERSSGPALDGYCPVALVENRQWQRGKAEFNTVHHGKTYFFADKAAQEAFLKDPQHYAPASDGNDPVLAVDKGLIVAGRREHGAFYNGRVYLFSDDETFRAFDAWPERYLESSEASEEATLPPPKSEAVVEKIAAPADGRLSSDERIGAGTYPATRP